MPLLYRNSYKHVVKLLLSSGSHTILVFPFQTVWQSDGNSLGALTAVGYEVYEQIAIFDQYLALSRK